MIAQGTRDFQWLKRRTPVSLSPDAKGIQIVRGGEIVAQVAIDMETPAAAFLHVAVDVPAALRTLVRETFDWLFNASAKRVLLCAVVEGNVKSRALVTGLGFREVYRVEGGWDAREDLVFYEMRREECRWLKPQRRAA